MRLVLTTIGIPNLGILRILYDLDNPSSLESFALQSKPPCAVLRIERVEEGVGEFVDSTGKN